jgi:hypothetical protein
MAAKIGGHVENTRWFLFDVDQGVLTEITWSPAIGLENNILQLIHVLFVFEVVYVERLVVLGLLALAHYDLQINLI